MKLLLDENLSSRLVPAINDLSLTHAIFQDCGLEGASDERIWLYAREKDFAIVSKDSDFAERSALHGGPPKSSGFALATAPPPAQNSC